MANNVVGVLGRKKVKGLSDGQGVGVDSPLLKRERDNLYFILRQVRKQNSKSEKPSPYPAQTLQKLEPGALEHGLAIFAYLGDVQLRFVFEQSNGDRTLAKMQDLKNLDLNAEQAFAVASENMNKRMATPRVMEQPAGFYQLGGGENVDQNTDFWFARNTWVEQAKKHQSALVVALPRRGAVFFAPHNNAKAVAAMKNRAQELYAKAGEQRVSGKLFGFTGSQWKLFDVLDAGDAKSSSKKTTQTRTTPTTSTTTNANVTAQALSRARKAGESKSATLAHANQNDNLYRTPDADLDDYDSEFDDESAYSEDELEDIISGQKAMKLSVLANFVLAAAVQYMPLGLIVVLGSLIILYGVHGVFKTCTAAKFDIVTKVLGILGMLFFLTSLIVVLVLSHKATKILRDEGYEVGFFGVK